jgi:hypothetical protein
MDKNPESYQWLVLFILQAILLILLSQLNQSLATVSIFLFINGLLITFPALVFFWGQGLATVLMLTLFYDSGEAWKLGDSLIPNLTAFTIIYILRGRIRYDKIGVIKLVVLVTNLFLFVYYTVKAGARFPVTSPFVFLNLWHLLVSQLVLLAFSGWLITYHKEVLRMIQVDVDTNSRAAK